MSRKILIAYSGRFCGGAEDVMLRVTRFLYEEGYEVSVLLNGTGEVRGILEDEKKAALPKIAIYECDIVSFASKKKPFSFLRNVFRATSLLRKNSFDIVIFEGKFLTQVMALSSYLMGVSSIAYIHFPLSEYEVGRLFLSRVKKIVVCAEALKSYLSSLLVPAEKIEVVKNYVDSELFPFEAKTEKELGDRLNILHVGHLSEVKGQAFLLQAAKRLKQKGYNFNVSFAGCDNDASNHNERLLKALCRQLDLEDCVEFLGKVSDMPPVYRLADIFVLPSLKEGLPLVILEAMASGVPVIASAVDGSPEVIEENISGLLVEPRNIDMLVEKIEMLLQDAVLRNELASSARLRVEQAFNKHQFNARILEVIEKS